MNYATIEQYFTENKLEELLKLYESDFIVIDDYSKQFTNNILNSPVECQESLDVLTGLYMKLVVVFNISDYQYHKRKELSKINKDFSISTFGYLRVKNIFKAYLDALKKAILSCQSQLKFYIEEMRMTK